MDDIQLECFVVFFVCHEAFNDAMQEVFVNTFIMIENGFEVIPNAR